MQQNYLERAGKALTLSASLFFGNGCGEKANTPPEASQTASPVEAGAVGLDGVARWRSYPDIIAREISYLPAFRIDSPCVIERGGYTALVFLNSNCPLAVRSIEKLNNLEKEFSAKLKLQIVGVFPRPGETTEGIKEFAMKYGADIAVMLDPSAIMADALHAERSPEVFLLDNNLQLIYRGSIDDNQRVRGANPTVRNDYFRDVLENLTKDQPAPVPVTDVEGCLLERPNLSTIYPTWSRDIGPIVEKNCAGCHNQDQIAAIMPLTTREEVTGVAKTVAERVEDRTMPPWRAAGPRDKFEHDLRLDPMEIWAFKAWERENMPAGNGSFQVDPNRYVDQRHVRNPDMVVEMLDPAGDKPWYTVRANGLIPYQTFIAPKVFEEDKWLVASEVTAHAPQSLHHVSVFIVPPNDTAGTEYLAKSTMAKMFAVRRFGIMGAEYENVFRFYGPNLTRQINLAGFYAPGEGYMELSQERGVLIRKGSQLAFECHYVSTGKEVQDRVRIALKFGEMPAQAEGSRIIVRTGAPRIPRLVIPPNEEKTITKTMPIFADAEIRGIRPHMHLRGKEYRCEVERPGEERETVIHIPAGGWDVNWERYYVLKDPVQMPAGTKLHLTYTWDNTAANPNNPDPDKEVTFGTSLNHEMGLSWLSIVYRNPEDTTVAERKLQEALDDPDFDEKVRSEDVFAE